MIFLDHFASSDFGLPMNQKKHNFALISKRCLMYASRSTQTGCQMGCQTGHKTGGQTRINGASNWVSNEASNGASYRV